MYELKEMKLLLEAINEKLDNFNYYRSCNHYELLEAVYGNREHIKDLNKKNNNDHDSYHTIEELYEHRTVLFALVCSKFPDIAWKSEKHSDGTSMDGWFIAGLETPYGQITYHQKSFYWNLFDCKVLETAPKYDGHTPDHVLTRLSQLITHKI